MFRFMVLMRACRAICADTLVPTQSSRKSARSGRRARRLKRPSAKHVRRNSNGRRRHRDKTTLKVATTASSPQSLGTEELVCRLLDISPRNIQPRPLFRCPTSTAATTSLPAVTTRHRLTNSLISRCMANVCMPLGEPSCFAPLCVLTLLLQRTVVNLTTDSAGAPFMHDQLIQSGSPTLDANLKCEDLMRRHRQALMALQSGDHKGPWMHEKASSQRRWCFATHKPGLLGGG